MAKKFVCECPKCGGAGKIEAFRNVENGDCFRCGGRGTIEVAEHIARQQRQTTDNNAAKETFIRTATPEQIEQMSWKQLHDSRTFAAMSSVGGGDLFAVWQRRFGMRWNEFLASRRRWVG